MFCKVLFIGTLLAVGVYSLECIFDAESPATQLNVHDGVDTCEASDQYCAKININGIYAKGCSKTAAKITEGSLKVSCTDATCNADNSLCCCKGNKCNGVEGISVVMPLAVLGVVKILLR